MSIFYMYIYIYIGIAMCQSFVLLFSFSSSGVVAKQDVTPQEALANICATRRAYFLRQVCFQVGYDLKTFKNHMAGSRYEFR